MENSQGSRASHFVPNHTVFEETCHALPEQAPLRKSSGHVMRTLIEDLLCGDMAGGTVRATCPWAPGTETRVADAGGGGPGSGRRPAHLDVHVHQLVLLQDVVDLPRLQPGMRLLLLLLQVDEDPQAALGVVQCRSVGPGVRAGSGYVSPVRGPPAPSRVPIPPPQPPNPCTRAPFPSGAAGYTLGLSRPEVPRL